jgi:CubicO group peptidase (beta-lactamase class C family)
MSELEGSIDRIAEETRFSGVLRIDRDGTRVERAYGLADRAHGIANTVDTRFAIASGAKSLTALAVMSLVEEGRLELATTARSILGEDLPLIDDAVTVEQLLSHRSGIGDFFDEDIDRPITDHILTVPVHRLDRIEAYLEVLDGFPMKFAPGERFAYNNEAFVVLALIAERASGTPFFDLVVERVCRPAGMGRTAFLRSDELPGDVAIGYLDDEGLRTNVLIMPAIGGGDGGAFSTLDDVTAMWAALFDGRIVSKDTLAEMTRSRSDVPGENPRRYGLGFWLHPTSDVVEFHGYDAGVSFRSTYDPASGETRTLMSNTADGAWDVTERLDALLDG